MESAGDGFVPAGEPHSRYVDPRLAGATDARLQPGSPAIDAGLMLREAPPDFEGVTRPQGAGYDIGAYEFNPGKK
jgi:hypothetical protein